MYTTIQMNLDYILIDVIKSLFDENNYNYYYYFNIL